MSEGDGSMALRLVTDHIKECAEERRETKNSIKDVRNLLIAFMGVLGTMLITFAGYTYVQAQTLQSQLADARAKQAEAVSQIPAETAKQVGATLSRKPGD